jgi:UDP:flavonoid glycosyltransferase YjiC (YdhE family)
MSQLRKWVTLKNPGAEKISKRILFANVPADGHFNPLTGLAVHLKNCGYDVRWYSSSMYKQKIQKMGILYYPFVKAMNITQENMGEIFPERERIKGKVEKLNFDIINFFVLRGPEYFEDITAIYEEFPFDLFICDSTFTAIPFVKEKLNVPVYSIGIVPLPETSVDLAPAGLGLTPSKSFFGRRKQDFMRFFADKILFRRANLVVKKIMKENDIETNGVGLFDLLIKKADLLLQSGTPGFEYKRSDLSSNIRFMGPLLPYSNPDKSVGQWFDERLYAYYKVILVTQGTVEKDVEKIIVPTLEAFKDSNYLVVVTTGGSQTKELQKRYPQKNIIIEDFIPFEDVMPYADLYVTNGGYGGVLLGIQNQLPLLVAGVHEGKNEINARIGYFELGLNLKTEKPFPQQIKLATEKILADEKYKRNVEKLSAEFNEFNPNELCEKYVGEILLQKEVEKILVQEISKN